MGKGSQTTVWLLSIITISFVKDYQISITNLFLNYPLHLFHYFMKNLQNVNREHLFVMQLQIGKAKPGKVLTNRANAGVGLTCCY